jgi:hypothetical protein
MNVDKLESVLTEIGCKYEKINEHRRFPLIEYDAYLKLKSGFGNPLYCKFYFLKGRFTGYGCWED